MASFVIEGGHRLSGEIHPQGAKNEVLQIICATLLTAEEVTVNNIPDILDVNNLIHPIAVRYCQDGLIVLWGHFAEITIPPKW